MIAFANDRTEQNYSNLETDFKQYKKAIGDDHEYGAMPAATSGTGKGLNDLWNEIEGAGKEVSHTNTGPSGQPSVSSAQDIQGHK